MAHTAKTFDTHFVQHPSTIVAVMLTIMLWCITGCDPVDYRLKLSNKADYDVYYQYTGRFDPTDTSIADRQLTPLYRLKAGDSIAQPMHGSWQSVFQQYANIQWFFYRVDLVDSIDWERVQREYLVERRFDLTLDSIQRRGWVVQFP